MADLFSQFFGPDELVDFAVPEPRQVPPPPAVMMDPMAHLAYQPLHKEMSVDAAAYKNSAFMRELSGVHSVHNDNTMAGTVPTSSAPSSQSYHQIVPSLPPGGALASAQRFHNNAQFAGAVQAGNAGAQFTAQAASSNTHLATAVSGQYGSANAGAHFATVPPPTAHFAPAAQLPHAGSAYAAPASAPSNRPPAPTPAPRPPQPPAIPMNPAPSAIAAPAPSASFAVPPQAVGADGQVLTPTQLGELELARLRAARAAAGRRQQLIAQKRAREANKAAAAAAATQTAAAQQIIAQQEGSSRSAKTQALAPADNGRKPRRAAAGVTALTSTLSAALGSDEGAMSEDEGGTGEGEDQAGGTGDPVKDARKLKRLLRNRVSAQQARERKKQYVNTLEDQVKGLQERVAELEQSLANSEAQNTALRRIVRNMQSGTPMSPPDAHANQFANHLANAQRGGPGNGAGAAAGAVLNPNASLSMGDPASGSAPTTPASSGAAANNMMHSGVHAMAKQENLQAHGNGGHAGFPGGVNQAAGTIPVPPPLPLAPAEGSETSSHPGHGTAAAARRDDVHRTGMVPEHMSKAARLARQPTQSSLDVRAAAAAAGAAPMMGDYPVPMAMGGVSRSCRVDSLSLALDVEGVLGMGMGAAAVEEEEDCLVVPQAPPMTMMQHTGAEQAAGMSGPRNSQASLHSGAGSLNLQSY